MSRPEEQQLTPPPGFGGAPEVTSAGERNVAAQVAEARALIEARHVLALRMPRDIDVFRVRILKDCQRPRFCQAAFYDRPVGGGERIVDFSIRFMETAAQHFGNIYTDQRVTFDDAERQKIYVQVTDFERGVGHGAEIVIHKTVERRTLKPGQVPLGERINSTGQRVFLVEGDEGAVRAKAFAEVSKLIRTCLKRLLPADILEEAYDAIEKMRKSTVAADPDAERKRLVDAFAKLGVLPDELKKYLGHDLAGASPAELEELGGLYLAVKDGDSTWPELLNLKTGTAPTDAAAQQKAEALKGKVGEHIKKAREVRQARGKKPERQPGDEG